MHGEKMAATRKAAIEAKGLKNARTAETALPNVSATDSIAMMMAAVPSSEPSPELPPFEKCAFYNIRYTGRSQWGRLHRKQENLAHLMGHHTIVGLSEPHASAAVAESVLFQHHPSHMACYHCAPKISGQAILVERRWASKVTIGQQSTEQLRWGAEVVVHGSMHAIWWIDGLAVRGILNIYLDSHSAEQRVHQLRGGGSLLRSFRERVVSWGSRDGHDYHVEWICGGTEISRRHRNIVKLHPRRELGTQELPPWTLGKVSRNIWGTA